MTTLRQAAEQALEALELWDRRDNGRAMLTDEAINEAWAVSDAAIDTLRAALAAPDEVAAAVEAEREACKTFIRELEKRSWVDYDHANDPVDKGMAIGFSYSALIISMRSKP